VGEGGGGGGGEGVGGGGGGVLLVDVCSQRNHYNHVDHSKNTCVFQVHNL